MRTPAGRRGTGSAGSTANFGGSPGDAEHHEPYLYVGGRYSSRSDRVAATISSTPMSTADSMGRA